MHTKNNIPVTWQPKDWLSYEWEEKFMGKEVPKDDVWNSPATKEILKQEKLWAQSGINSDCTKHYMSIRPPLSQGLQEILKHYKTVDHNYNFLKLTAGHNIVKHYDSYASFIKFNNIPEEMHKKIKRTIVMMTEWSFGQVLQIHDSIESHWQIGNTYTWEGDTWHGLGNFGLDDCVIMQVTWL